MRFRRSERPGSDDSDAWTEVVLGASLVTMALVAGLNFTFASAVMPNLAGDPDRIADATSHGGTHE